MSNIQIPNLPAVIALDGTEQLEMVQAGVSSRGTATQLAQLARSYANQTPASASATGTAGTIVYDSSFLYVCIATDTWKRVAIATW